MIHTIGLFSTKLVIFSSLVYNRVGKSFYSTFYCYYLEITTYAYEHCRAP